MSTQVRYSDDDSEAAALLQVVMLCARTGIAGSAFDAAAGEVRWRVEADTKVDEFDPFFPVVVHFRGERL